VGKEATMDPDDATGVLVDDATGMLEDDATAVLVVMTTAPDRQHADRIARALVDERLAACVTILAPATSVYRWQGALETAEELPLLIKTAAARMPRLQQRLLELHPYEVPEILALPAVAGLSAYVGWVVAESAASADE
jgi:periplasmic divalent cation tolerance protein